MPRGLRKKTKQYVLDRFQEEDPEAYFQYKAKASHGLTHDQMEFLQAVETLSTQKVKSMLNRGVDPNFFVVGSRETPLHFSVENKPGAESSIDKIVGVLLFFGADPNAKDKKGQTPLHAACQAGRASVVEMLIQAGGRVDILDERKESPLLVACSALSQESVPIVNMLIENGTIVSAVNDLGQTALHRLTTSDFTPCAEMVKVKADVGKLLLQSGLCADVVDSRGLYHLSQELNIQRIMPIHIADTSLSEVLVLGGASLDTEMLILRDTAVKPLTFLITKLHHLMLRSDLSRYLQHLQGLGRRLDVGEMFHLTNSIESSLASVFSLSKLSCISIRSSLGGNIFSASQQLPLPNKLKEYIQSGE